MSDRSVYYEYNDEQLVPIWNVIRVDRLHPDWSKPLYLPLETPFTRFAPEEFEGEVSVSVLLSDLVINPEQKYHYGIHLPRIAQRVMAEGLEPDEIQLLVIRMDDLEELIHMQKHFAFGMDANRTNRG